MKRVMVMIRRIKEIHAEPDYWLDVLFDDGRHVKYDMKEDFHLPGYSILQEETGLFQQVQVDPSRNCVCWTEEIDLPSDILYEYGTPCRQ